MALHITAAPDDPDLLDLPWSLPLEEWPAKSLVALPRGISRHIVRFVRLGGRVYAVKEVPASLAEREYRLLRDLSRLDVPTVEAVGVITGRTDDHDQPLEAALVTRHLEFSLPYRALFSRTLRPHTVSRLLDALAVLLVQLHLVGFSWGDCSLSNTLFRRDAGAFAAYLVDAETGELHSRLSDGQRAYDLELARVNIGGEMLDLQAGGLLDDEADPIETAEQICHRYERLWGELTRPDVIEAGERHVVDARLRRLNDLGFDVAELTITAVGGGRRVKVAPKVVDAGHHSRRLLRLTGLDAEENQARRLLNDIDYFRASLGAARTDEEEVAQRWVSEMFEPVIRTIPRDLRRKLEAAQIYHEVLEHRWYLSEHAGHDVGLDVATRSYIDNVLAFKPDEEAILGARLGPASTELSYLGDTAEQDVVAPGG
ncbi:MAG: DUF4032 domain-containing protein [Actinomycetes bacterium]